MSRIIAAIYLGPDSEPINGRFAKEGGRGLVVWRWCLLPFAFALLLSFGSALAQQQPDPATGHGYLNICSREEDDWRLACNFYSAGLNNMLLTIDIMAGGHQLECAPGHTTLADKQSVFIAFLKANPQLQNGGSAALYMQAISEAFPCSAK
jgi:hypothetical protein